MENSFGFHQFIDFTKDFNKRIHKYLKHQLAIKLNAEEFFSLHKLQYVKENYKRKSITE